MERELISVLSNQLKFFEECGKSERRSRSLVLFEREAVATRDAVETWVQEQVSHANGSITGLLAMHIEASTGILLVEAPEDIHVAFLREMVGQTSVIGGLFEQAKVLTHMDDCEAPLFARFDCFGIFRPREQEVVFPEGIAMAGESAYHDLSTLGAELLQLDSVNIASAKENLATGKNCADSLKKMPSHERILAFLQVSAVLSLGAFVQLFCAPMEESFIRDDVWPHQYSIPAWLMDTTQTKP